MPRLAAPAALAAALGLGACAGGPSDVPGAPAAGEGTGRTLTVYAFATAKPAYDALLPAFAATGAGRGVDVRVAYGPSGDQSRKVAAGAPADVVSLAAAPDVERLVDADLVDEAWDAGPDHGSPFGSVVTVVVRPGNPRGISTWEDLLTPGVEVVTPSPLSSGSARWNLLAPYAAASDRGRDPGRGDALARALVTDHVAVHPASSRQASDTFLHGRGDALLAFESEALFLERAGEDIEHVTPTPTVLVETPVAVVRTSPDPELAAAFVDFLRSPAARTALEEAGFRPGGSATDPAAATIRDLGGWERVEAQLFAPGSGSLARAYAEASR